MIVAGSDKGIWIDLGKDEPGMTLQREYREGGYRVWRDYLVDGKPFLPSCTMKERDDFGSENCIFEPKL